MMKKSNSKRKGQKKQHQKDQKVEQVAAAITEHPDDTVGDEDMPEEKTIVLTAVKPEETARDIPSATPPAGQGGTDSPNPDDWMISVVMKSRQNAVLHVAGLMNLIVSLELIGKSATSEPEVAKNQQMQEIYAHNINEAQTLAMLHITQLVVQHKISWDEVLESMVSDYMRNVPETDRTPEREDSIRAQAYSVISTGYEIINRCRNAAVARASGDNGGVERKSD